jgi:hypothetical protein
MSKVKELWGRSKVIIIAVVVAVLVLIVLGVWQLMIHLNETAAENERIEKLTIQYNEAVALLEQGNYSRARSSFESLRGFMDSQDRAEEAKNKQADVVFNDILAEIEQEEWLKALKLINGTISTESNLSERLGSEKLGSVYYGHLQNYWYEYRIENVGYDAVLLGDELRIYLSISRVGRGRSPTHTLTLQAVAGNTMIFDNGVLVMINDDGKTFTLQEITGLGDLSSGMVFERKNMRRS